MKRSIKGCSVTLAVVSMTIIGILYFIWWFGYLPADSQQRQYPGLITTIFAEALRTNRARMAKSVASPQMEERIDKWIKGHEPVNCSSITGYSGGECYTENGANKANYNYLVVEPCPDIRRMYCFFLDDITLEEQESGWLIVDWGNVSESRGPECANQPKDDEE